MDSRVGAVEEGIKHVQSSLDALTIKMEKNNDSLETKIDKLIESSIRLQSEAEHDKKVQEAQASGLLDLGNRVTLTDGEVNKVKTEIAVMKQASADLLERLDSNEKEMEKRTATNRFLIGTVGLIAASLNYLINFFTQHFRP